MKNENMVVNDWGEKGRNVSHWELKHVMLNYLITSLFQSRFWQRGSEQWELFTCPADCEDFIRKQNSNRSLDTSQGKMKYFPTISACIPHKRRPRDASSEVFVNQRVLHAGSVTSTGVYHCKSRVNDNMYSSNYSATLYRNKIGTYTVSIVAVYHKCVKTFYMGRKQGCKERRKQGNKQERKENERLGNCKPVCRFVCTQTYKSFSSVHNISSTATDYMFLHF